MDLGNHLAAGGAGPEATPRVAAPRSRMSYSWDGSDSRERRSTTPPSRTTLLREYEGDINTILIPPGTQYGATQGNPQKGKRFIYAVFASLCKPLQRMNYHS
jgi:hypothetical protein